MRPMRWWRAVLAAALLVAPPHRAAAQEPAEVRQGRALLAAGRAREARQMLRPFAERQPRGADGAAAFWTGRAFLAEGDWEEAERWLERALERSPAQADYHYWAGVATAERVQRAGMVTAMRRAGRIRERWERAVALDPRHVDARESLVEYYLNAPAIAGGSREKAEEQARVLSGIDVAAGHRATASIRIAAEDSVGAIAALRSAVAAEPGRAETRMTLGLGLQSMGRWDEALATFEEALAHDPRALAALYQVGRTAALSGKYLEKGEAALRAYVAAPAAPDRPAHAAAWWRLGQVLRHGGRTAEARAALETALRLDPKQEGAKRELAELNRGD
jgi:tetratricopeptide (TPR) repeat protein